MKRFWNKVEKTETCWLWAAYISTNGYGYFNLDGRPTQAHRVAFELTRGPIPDGLVTDHLCRVRHCVNPDHLEPVTHRENILRGDSPNAHNARKTHCIHGHPFNAENTYVRSNGNRMCRPCLNRRRRETRARKKAKP